jgi:hypothetical protein
MTTMTFDELMEKYLPLIEEAAADQATGDRGFDHLVAAVKEDLRPFLSDAVPVVSEKEIAMSDLEKGARMAAKELLSRFTFPEGGGAAHEGQLGGSWSEADSLDPAQAEEPAPPPVTVDFSDKDMTENVHRIQQEVLPRWVVVTTTTAKRLN